MTTPIRLVQGDANIPVDFTVTDKNTRAVVNLTGASVKLYFRKENSDVLTDTIDCTLPNGGSDGVIRATLTEACMAEAGTYFGEIETTIGLKVQTLYDKQKFYVREQVQV